MTDWVKILADEMNSPIPKGWSTSSEIAKQLKISIGATLGRLHRRKARGLVEQRQIQRNGRNTAIWRIIDAKAGK